MPKIKYRNHLIISVSGGRSSALAAMLVYHFKKRYKYRTRTMVFANTGLENPLTIKFLMQLEAFLKQKIWKLEFVRVGDTYTYKVIDCWSDLSMDGQPFKEAIRYHNSRWSTGMPNISAPFCSSLLKKFIIRKFSKDYLGTVKYAQCIGYRAEDMPKRINWAAIKATKGQYIYPLITHYDEPVTSKKLTSIYRSKRFKLELPSEIGNCQLCWKKSDKNLHTAIVRDDSTTQTNIDFYKQMEAETLSTSFRGRRSIDEIIKSSNSSTLTGSESYGSCDCGV